jgi:hypothetical protein
LREDDRCSEIWEEGNGERRKVCVIGGTEAGEYQMKTLQLALSIHRCAYVCFSRTWPMPAREMYDDRQRWYDVGAKSLGVMCAIFTCNLRQYRKYGLLESVSVSNVYETCVVIVSVDLSAEFDALFQTKTWTLVPRSFGVNIVGSKWIF